MYVAKLKNNNIFQSSNFTFSHLEKNSFKVAIITFVVFGFLLLLFFRPSLITTQVDAQSLRFKGVSSNTMNLVNELNDDSLGATYISEINRANFSKTGSLIALSGDNIQVYEYSSPQEATSVAQSYKKMQINSQWHDQTHIYTKGSMLVFYLGTKENILKSLDKIMK